jgi:natural product biosynthesis luciferase-like monooxygenase protein
VHMQSEVVEKPAYDSLLVRKIPAYSCALTIESPGRKANTFTDVLLSRAQTHAEHRAYIFLRDGEEEEATLTFSQLLSRALAVGEKLSELGKPGDRAILLYPAGLDFIVAFFGCLCAGIIPVPASVPNRKRSFGIVRGIAEDSGARWILSSQSVLVTCKDVLALDPVLSCLPALDTEAWPIAPRADWQPLPSTSADTALLQYTSGSTATPKGVVVTHANLMDNHRQTARSFGAGDQTIIMSWLPMFHDMGLGNVLGAVWLGVPCILMSPSSFLQKPVRWLRAISKYRATSSGGPDFAYTLCCQRISPEDRRGLDLSSWATAYNGSEPVRASTLIRFSEVFAASGFRHEAFHPVYGLAEATLFVSSNEPGEAPIVRRFSRTGLEEGEGKPGSFENGSDLVSGGRAWLDGRVTIVDPSTLVECKSDRIGEIWVGGPSVAAGYWNKEAETLATFRAHTASGDGPYLRTGDLGFIHAGNLFITGRSKDLIIVRGRNHYPQDIEATVSESHPDLDGMGCAAFAVESDDGEQLVIAQEVKRTALHGLDAEKVFRAIRNVVADGHGLQTYAIVLLRPASLPRTTSGKIRRRACQQNFLNGSLPAVAAWVFEWEEEASTEVAGTVAVKSVPAAPISGAQVSQTATNVSKRTAEPLIEWLRGYSGGTPDSPASDVLPTHPSSLMFELANHGLLGMQVAAQYGGMGLGHFETARVLEQLAAIDLSASLLVGFNNYLGIAPIARHADSRLKEALLPRLASGQAMAGFALAEPGIGSNPDGLESYAEVRNGSGWQLYGNKYASGEILGAGVINVFVRHHDRPGVTAFVVPQDTTGVHRASRGLRQGTQGVVRSHISLDGVKVGHDQVLGLPGQGLDIALDALAHARLALAAACLGGMKRCAQLVFHHATQRQTATGRLVAHPVTLSKLGRLTAGVTALECLVRQISRAADSGNAVPSEAFMVCKVVAPEMLWQAVDDLVQLLGRRGYVETPHVRDLVRDAQALRSCEGPSEAMSALLGERVMGASEASVTRLVAEVFGAPAVAPLIGVAVQAIRVRLAKNSVGRHKDPMHWEQTRAGELTMWIVLLAAVEGELHQTPSPDSKRAALWARANFDRALSQVQSEAPLDSSGIPQSVATYSRSIGDVDPLLAWMDDVPRPITSPPPALDGPAAIDSRTDEIVDTRQLTEGQQLGAAASPASGVGLAPLPVEASLPDFETVRAWLIAQIRTQTGVKSEKIDPSRPFAELGLDSLRAASISGAAETWLKRRVSPVALWDYPTIDELARHLAQPAPAPKSELKARAESAALPNSATLPVPIERRVAAMSPDAALSFSLMYFSSNEAESQADKYRLVLEGSKIADEAGLEAVWLPERHFHPFGGLYPEPAALAAALAMITKRIRLRAGSVVLPLNEPVRVAERWAVVDNLSGGRVDLAFATGWNPNDFVLSPSTYASRVETTLRGIDTVQRLWRGETLELANGVGQPVGVKIFPVPRQAELGTWLTCTGNRERFVQAGAIGANVLTALLFQSVDTLAQSIEAYRKSRAENGHDPSTGRVTLMLHTFLGGDIEVVRQQVMAPFKEYLRSSVDLWRQGSSRLEELSLAEQERALDYAFERYWRTSALFGTPESCQALVLELNRVGVNEIACLIDFGVDHSATLGGLHRIGQLRDLAARALAAKAARTEPAVTRSFASAAGTSSGPSVDTRLDDEIARLERELKSRRE